MKLFSVLTRLFRPAPKFQLETGHSIIPAFKIGGVQYYCYEDVFRMNYKRGLGAIKYYEEFRMRCTREYLIAHYEAVKKILTQPEKGVITLTELHKFNEQLGERLNWIIEADSLYKFCSVVFFDATEDPYDYDMKHCLKKIAIWKKHEGVRDFFLRQELVRLIPYLAKLPEDTSQVLSVIEKINRYHLESLSQVLSDEMKKTDLWRSYGWLTETQAS